MAFNMYSTYSYAAQNMQGATDDKIICDIERLKHIQVYDEFNEYLTRTFGEVPVGEEKTFEYPNNVLVIIKRDEDSLMFGALKDEKQIFGRGWDLRGLKK